MATFICETCGKVETLKADNQRFCSTDCRNVAKKKRLAPVAPDPGLREAIAVIIAKKAIHWNEVRVDGPYRSLSEKDRCEDAADAVLSVLAERGVR